MDEAAVKVLREHLGHHISQTSLDDGKVVSIGCLDCNCVILGEPLMVDSDHAEQIGTIREVEFDEARGLVVTTLLDPIPKTISVTFVKEEE